MLHMVWEGVKVSVLFNEPKLLKCHRHFQSAEPRVRFSALQRAEIAEICRRVFIVRHRAQVSVLFNEPKLLKFRYCDRLSRSRRCFSALQRAEIAEIDT